jgi:hypothetical protein
MSHTATVRIRDDTLSDSVKRPVGSLVAAKEMSLAVNMLQHASCVAHGLALLD